jgi:soluble lytic murein transglycosylase-like protein
MNSFFQFAIVAAMLAGAAQAADLAVLRNGNSIRHERRQVIGPVTRLYLTVSDSGYIEIPTDQIERFERETAPQAPPLAAAKPQAAPTQSQVKAPTAALSPLSREGLNQVVAGAGERHQIDPDFINSVIRAESGFHQNAVSKKGAQGLMQLMPGTATQLGVANSFDPNANVEGGTKYLRELLEKYNYDPVKALAAYNAGSKRVDKYHGVPPYYETQAYIARIIRDYNRQKIAENPALGRKTKSSNQHSAVSDKQSASRPSSTTAKAPTAKSQKQATAVAESLSQGTKTASR